MSNNNDDSANDVAHCEIPATGELIRAWDSSETTAKCSSPPSSEAPSADDARSAGASQRPATTRTSGAGTSPAAGATTTACSPSTANDNDGIAPACPECGSECERITADPRSTTQFDPFWRCTSCGLYPIGGPRMTTGAKYENPDISSIGPGCLENETIQTRFALSPRTRTSRRLTLRGWRFKAICVCGRSMRFHMPRFQRDIWAGHHEDRSWCDD